MKNDKASRLLHVIVALDQGRKMTLFWKNLSGVIKNNAHLLNVKLCTSCATVHYNYLLRSFIRVKAFDDKITLIGPQLAV